MRSTGVVRRIDELGRIVIPIEVRRVNGWEIREAIEIYTENDTVVLKKYAPGCTCCKELENLVTFKGITICKKCLVEANKYAEQILNNI